MEFMKVIMRCMHISPLLRCFRQVWIGIVTAHLILIGLMACATPEEMRTDGIPVVSALDLERYQGRWYEIMRLPNSFEEGLEQVTATYTLQNDGEIQVLNRGYNLEEDGWEDAEGRAWLPDPAQPALLKVSFFWIFSSDYRVIALDQDNYSYAMVTSSSKKYLWILSRTPVLEEDVLNMLIGKAKGYGFAVEHLEQVRQN